MHANLLSHCSSGSGNGNVVPSQTLSLSQTSSQENPRYLTHSKRPRVD